MTASGVGRRPRSRRPRAAPRGPAWLAVPLLVVAGLPFIQSCSVVLASLGPEEAAFVPRGSTRSDVRRTLGPPIEIVEIEPIRVGDLPRFGTQLLVASAGVDDRGGLVYPPRIVTVREIHRYVGAVEHPHDIGEALSVGLFTFFLTEPFMIPEAIRRKSGSTVHTVEVWYAADGTALAYRWNGPH